MFVIPSLGVGGSENSLLRLIDRLDKNKYNCSICYFEKDASLLSMKSGSSSAVKTYYLEKKDGIDIDLIRSLSRLFKKNNIHIVHARNWSSIFYGAISAKLAGGRRSVIGDVRGEIKSAKQYFGLKILSFAVRKFIAVNHDIALELITRSRIRFRKIKVIHNGVDTEGPGVKIDRAQARVVIGLDGNDLVIGAVGRLAKVKDYHTLLRAFQAIKKRSAKAKLIMIGDGPEKAALEKLANELGIAGDVLFLGARGDVENIYPAMDIFVLTSIFEGSPNSLLEAMAAGVPAVATEVGGNKEIIEHGISGMLFRPGDHKGLAEVITRIAGNRFLAEKLALNAKKRVREEFPLSKTIRSYEDVYAELTRSI